MVDVNLAIQSSVSTSAVSAVVVWIKNGGTPVIKAHPINPNIPYAFSYLNDVGIGAATTNGDVISATVAEVDASGNSSPVLIPTPSSITIPTAPPLPPQSATLILN